MAPKKKIVKRAPPSEKQKKQQARMKAVAAKWRALSAAEKAKQGPYFLFVKKHI